MVTVYLEKLIRIQLAPKSSSPRKFIALPTRILPAHIILSQTNPVLTFIPYLHKIHFNIIYVQVFLAIFSPSEFPFKVLYTFHYYMPYFRLWFLDIKTSKKMFILSRVGVTIDGVWIGKWIYWNLTNRNYN
jgi:hypothetical protein